MADRVSEPRSDASLGELLKELAEETTTLVRQEIQLAKAEMTQKGKKLGMGAGFFGGAMMAGLMALGALTACLILALNVIMPAAAAAIIVTALFGVIALVLALQGRNRVKEAAPPAPEQTVETVKEDVEWLKNRR